MKIYRYIYLYIYIYIYIYTRTTGSRSNAGGLTPQGQAETGARSNAGGLTTTPKANLSGGRNDLSDMSCAPATSPILAPKGRYTFKNISIEI